MAACVAVINAGSSSIKFAIYAAGAGAPASFRGQIEGIGAAPSLKVADGKRATVAERSWDPAGFDHRQATQAILDEAIRLLDGTPVAAVGHRVVHGGTEFAAPVRVDAATIAALRKLAPLAPLHQPHNVAAIAAIAEGAPHVAQVACFDTAFHRAQPDVAQLFAVPRALSDEGVRRYGFHGLSYEYVSQRLYELAPQLAGARVIIAHLGNGASLCAIRGGRSVATTMGFTALDGLMMGTRCGSLDPGVLLYLMDEKGLGARAIEDLLYRRSGLLGVSGVSADMRALQALDDPAAREAIELFVYRIVREIGSLAAALGGLDALVFTGGIGEHGREIREAVSAGCRWLGVEIDPARNRMGAGLIGKPGSRAPAWVIPTDEEGMIARHTSALLGLR